MTYGRRLTTGYCVVMVDGRPTFYRRVWYEHAALYNPHYAAGSNQTSRWPPGECEQAGCDGRFCDWRQYTPILPHSDNVVCPPVIYIYW